MSGWIGPESAPKDGTVIVGNFDTKLAYGVVRAVAVWVEDIQHWKISFYHKTLKDFLQYIVPPGNILNWKEF